MYAVVVIKRYMPGDITILIAQSQKGDQEARDMLYRKISPVLRSIAANHLRKEKSDHTLGIEGVVDEAFMKLVELKRMEFNDREHFKAQANTFMKWILENYRRWKERHWGKNTPLEEALIAAIPYVPELANLRESVELLGKDHPRCKEALELHYYDGFKQQEVADMLGFSKRAIEEDLRFAKAWIKKEWEESKPDE